MTYRVRHLVNDEIQSSDNSTYVLRLPTTGFLHTLFLTAHCTNGATSGRGVSIFDVVDEIRVVGDGDERYFTLNPREIEKHWETLRGEPLQIRESQAASAVQEGVFPLMFGRAPYDPNMFLPLGRIKNPRLEVVYSPAIAADGGFATGTTTFNVTALWSPEQDRLNYIGTLVTRTVEDFTSVASGDNATDIDIQDLIRYVGVYVYESGVEDGLNITKVRLEANSGEFDIFQGDWQDLLDYNRSMFWARIKHNARLLIADTETWNARLGNVKHFAVSLLEDVSIAADTFTVAQVDTIAGDLLTFNLSTADVTAGAEDLTAKTADSAIYVSVEGDSPSYFGMIPFMLNDEPSDYLNPRGLDKLRVLLTQGNAGANVRISLNYLKQLQ